MGTPRFLNTNLEEKLKALEKFFSPCKMCPKECQALRLNNEKGDCQIGRYAVVSSFGPHFGEEEELVGENGSGTIFFSGCNLHCVYCQNYEISQYGEGKEVSAEELAKMMLRLQRIGCHNINLVSPTHVVYQIVEALIIAKKEGLKIPIVYNSGGYDKVGILKILEGVIDIYMPDMKYSDNEYALKYSKAKNYWKINKMAVKEMHRQVGDLKVVNGIAYSGLLIRHLVLPNKIAGSFKILEFIAKEISKDSYVNIMAQYRPCYRANHYLELSRRITKEEYEEVIEYAKKLGLYRGF
uniref:Radical SAM protein n=1 Tax=candidate division WOR-3 bacterium TaxID=2052148 RepID=A0A7V3ZUI2_UNCW3